MDLSIGKWTSVGIIIIMMILLLVLIAIIWNEMTYWSRKGVPHISTLPIIGSKYATFFFGNMSVVDLSEAIYNNFPDAKYFGFTMWNRKIIMIKDIDLIRDVCVKNFDNAPDHRSFIDEKMDPILGKNVFSLKGDRWRQVRSALSPSFTASKMKFLFELISKVSDDFVQYLEQHPEVRQLIDTKDAFTRYTNDVIATSAFGISVDSMKNPTNEFYMRGKDATNLSGAKRIMKFFAGITFPRLMRFFGQTFLSKETNKFFISLIRDTVKLRDQQGSITRPDMIHLLMRARDNSNGIHINIDDIVAQAFIFFLAGFDTSSTLMSFLFHQLAYHPHVQEKLRQEIDNIIISSDHCYTYDDLSKMKYMDMIINETLRLYVPVTFIDRVCEKPFELPPATSTSNKLKVEKDTILWINVYSMQRDPKYFTQPEKFIPERFSQENIIPYTFMPFGVGPRKCIGERFALMETKLIIARIIKKFIILPSERSTPVIKIAKSNLNLVPEGGIWLKFDKRL